MCGIAGIYNFGFDNTRLKESADRLCDYLAHRGPDSRGSYFNRDNSACIINTRLAIIDLTASAAQPMSDTQGNVWLTFNGEIYNYQELRRELETAGYSFKSDSDTEVVLLGYKEWGTEGLLKRLRGMFAFAVYDSRERPARFILCRDRFGIKPLYYYRDERIFVFASEVGAIVNSGIIPVEKDKFADMAFLIFGYIPGPMTTIKNIVSLPCSSYLVVDEQRLEPVKYYDLMDSFCAPRLSRREDVYERLRLILVESVKIHMISDAPLGVFLSGGIDSSALAAVSSSLAQTAISTVSVVFDEKQYCESEFQEMIAARFKTDHHRIRITEDDFYDRIDDIFKAMDQPTCDGVNTYFVSRAAQEAGLKAVLSGLGGDELFCGYGSFRQARLLNFISRMSEKIRGVFSLAGALDYPRRKASYLKNSSDLELYLTFRGLFVPLDAALILGVSPSKVYDFLNNFRRSTIDDRLSTLNPVDRLSYMEMSFYMRDQLLKDTDFMSMHHSVEVRVPFLDHVLVDFVARIDSRLKIDRRIQKALLVKSLEGLLPDGIIMRRKQGFTFPFGIWLKKDGKGLLAAAARAAGMDVGYTGKLWSKFEGGALHWSRIWALIALGNKKY